MPSEMTKKFTKEFLILYREKECLWRKESDEFKDRRAKAEAYEELLDKYREVYSEASLRDVKTKIEHLRTVYRRQLRLVLESAAREGPVFVPKLWYFPLLTFLHEEECPEIVPLLQSIGLHSHEVDSYPKGEASPAGARAARAHSDGSSSPGSPAATRNEPYDRRVLREVLEMYRQKPCLWRPDHPQYGNKAARGAATMRLLKIYRKFDRTATIDTVKKKIEFCRGGYKRELKKIVQNLESGQTYVPKLWYFNLLTFLDEEEHSDLSQLLPEAEMSDDAQTPEFDSFPEEWIEEEEEEEEEAEAEAEEARGGEAGGRNPLRTEYETHSGEGEAETRQSRRKRRAASGARDRHDVAGENVACKLRALEGEQRVHAEKLIGDVLYHAELRRLDGRSALLVAGHRIHM